jgi:hypothetical protein
VVSKNSGATMSGRSISDAVAVAGFALIGFGRVEIADSKFTDNSGVSLLVDSGAHAEARASVLVKHVECTGNVAAGAGCALIAAQNTTVQDSLLDSTNPALSSGTDANNIKWYGSTFTLLRTVVVGTGALENSGFALRLHATGPDSRVLLLRSQLINHRSGLLWLEANGTSLLVDATGSELSGNSASLTKVVYIVLRSLLPTRVRLANWAWASNRGGMQISAATTAQPWLWEVVDSTFTDLNTLPFLFSFGPRSGHFVSALLACWPGCLLTVIVAVLCCPQSISNCTFRDTTGALFGSLFTPFPVHVQTTLAVADSAFINARNFAGFETGPVLYKGEVALPPLPPAAYPILFLRTRFVDNSPVLVRVSTTSSGDGPLAVFQDCAFLRGFVAGVSVAGRAAFPGSTFACLNGSCPDYFVSAGRGSDAAAGTRDQPLRTLSEAVTRSHYLPNSTVFLFADAPFRDPIDNALFIEQRPPLTIAAVFPLTLEFAASN